MLLTGNYIQYIEMTYNRKTLKKDYIHTHIYTQLRVCVCVCVAESLCCIPEINRTL